MSEEEMLNKLVPLKKVLKITNEDIELLKEMKKNCLKSSVYEDDKRLLKANAISKFLICYEENEQLKNNWNELKKFVKERIKNANKCLNNPNENWDEDTNGYVLARKFQLEEMLKAMQELEGSDD